MKPQKSVRELGTYIASCSRNNYLAEYKLSQLFHTISEVVRSHCHVPFNLIPSFLSYSNYNNTPGTIFSRVQER